MYPGNLLEEGCLLLIFLYKYNNTGVFRSFDRKISLFAVRLEMSFTKRN